jgi:hypothetical protein
VYSQRAPQLLARNEPPSILCQSCAGQNQPHKSVSNARGMRWDGSAQPALGREDASRRDSSPLLLGNGRCGVLQKLDCFAVIYSLRDLREVGGLLCELNVERLEHQGLAFQV